MFLIQFHWQNPKVPNETEFVAQGEFDNPESVNVWARELIERRGNEKPDGWVPMLCDRHAPEFAVTRAL